MTRTGLIVLSALAIAVLLPGCRNGPCRRRNDPPPRRDTPPPLGDPIPPRVIPLEEIPPTGVPGAPGRGDFTDPIRRNYTPSEIQPAPPRRGPELGVLGEPILPAEFRQPILLPPDDPVFKPAKPAGEFPPELEPPSRPKLLTPQPLPAEVPDRADAPLPTPPVSSNDRRDLPPAGATPAPRDTKATRTPVELPDFATVLDRVTTSRKPELDGFAWLKTNGYRTVAYLHEPGDTGVTAAKELAEKQGLKFMAIPVSPETLGNAYTAFADLVKDANSRPLHVCATSGNRVGSLWYLVFRKVDLLTTDAARIRAGKFGLQDPTSSDEAKRFWLAINESLSNR